MECSVYDMSLKRLGLIRPYSLLWEEAYNGKGRFQLVVNKTEESVRLIQMERFAGIPASDTLMYVQSVEDKDGKIWAYGCEAKYLLYDRIYVGTLTCGNIEVTLRNAVAAARMYSFMDIGELSGLDKTLDSQQTYPDLFTLSTDWCGVAEYGFRLRHDKRQNKLLYEVYEGNERENVKFSRDYGNMANLVYKLSEADFKTVAYVGGAGEGAERKWVTVGAVDSSGIARREMTVDARDVQQEDGMTEAQYLALLESRGLEKLNEHNASREITFDVAPAEFGKRYGLGDIIRCILPEYALKLSIRVSGFERVYELNRETLTLILGTPVIRR